MKINKLKNLLLVTYFIFNPLWKDIQCIDTGNEINVSNNKNSLKNFNESIACLEKNKKISVIFDRKVKNIDPFVIQLTNLLNERKIEKMTLGTFPEDPYFFTALPDSGVTYIKVFSVSNNLDDISSSFYKYFPKNLKKLILGIGYEKNLENILKSLPIYLVTLRLRSSSLGKNGFNYLINYFNKADIKLENVSLNLNSLPKNMVDKLFSFIIKSSIKNVSFSSVGVIFITII
jgi:hypothetical protein